MYVRNSMEKSLLLEKIMDTAWLIKQSTPRMLLYIMIIYYI